MTWVLFAQVATLITLTSLLVGAVITSAIRAWREIDR